MNEFKFKVKKISIHDQVALTLWSLIIIVATLKALLYPEMRSVFHSYYQSGKLWLEQTNLYSGGRGFIYFPTFAALMAPLTLLGFHAASAIWEFIQSCVFVSGLYALSLFFKPCKTKSFFLWITLGTLPLAFSSLRNCQANILMSGILLWTTVAIARQKWSVASILLAIGLAIKPTFIVFFLLATATFRPLWKKVLITTFLVFLLPFLINAWPYVFSQYLGFVHMLEQAVNVGINEAGWASLLNVSFQLTGYHIPHSLQIIIRLLIALFTLLTCLKMANKTTIPKAALCTFILASAYLLMFNPRSENTDYVFIGYIYSFGFGVAFSEKNKPIMTAMALLVTGTLFASGLSKLFSDWESWVNPLLVTIFFTWFTFKCWLGNNFFIKMTEEKIRQKQQTERLT